MTKEQYQNYLKNNSVYEIIHNYYLEKTTIPLNIQDFIQFFNIYINLPIIDNGIIHQINPQIIFNNMLKITKDYYNNKYK